MKLAFREFGSGQPLIILHGLFGQSDNWNTLAKNFGEKGFRVFALDQRNHGLSPHSDDWSYELMAKDVKEFINDHSLQNVILLGHSMGGKTVMFFEYLFPNLTNKIIIADISSRAYGRHHNDVLDALNSVNLVELENRKQAEEKLGQHISDFGTKQFLLKNIFWNDDEKMQWRFNLKTINRLYDNIIVPVPNFKSETPTLIIRGEKSNYISETDLEDFKCRFSNSSFQTIVDAGHWIHAEKPKEFYEVVMKFIAA
jgi:esterase